MKIPHISASLYQFSKTVIEKRQKEKKQIKKRPYWKKSIGDIGRINSHDSHNFSTGCMYDLVFLITGRFALLQVGLRQNQPLD